MFQSDSVIDDVISNRREETLMRPIRIFLLLALVGFGSAVGFSAGYITTSDENSPVSQLIAKILRKLDELQGKPLPEERAVATIETTFIRFQGTLHPLPDTNWVRGGALTTWNKDLILVTQRGGIFKFLENEGLVELPIDVPSNGRLDYVELSETEEFSGYLHKPNSMRYNDILYVDRDDFRGFLLSYTFFDRERVCYGSRIARISIDREFESIDQFSAGENDWEIFFETSPCLELDPNWTALDGIMAGGRMALHPDGRIIFGSGEYHRDGIHTLDVGIMDPSTSYGKILAINYITGEAEILAVGHRNVQGVAVDSDGEIWTVEHAIRGGDELNHIKPGENHGWPLESLGTLYSGQPIPVPGEEGRHDVYDQPAFAWLPSAATSALTAVDDFHPAWDGGLIAGSLSNDDFGQSLFHIRTDGERVVFVERIRLKRRVRYVIQWGERLAVWLDPTDLLILTPVLRKDPLGDALAAIEERFSPEISVPARNILNKCAECHSFEQSNHTTAPSLNGIIGRNIAATSYSGHSSALARLSTKWTMDTITQYLTDPKGFAPGTTMPDQELMPGPVLDAVLWGLKEADTTDDKHLRY